jgi:cytochrome oxidase Cu insertion factor (SCO1/SenC/PrrC family)
MRALGLLLVLGALVAAGCGSGGETEEAAPPPSTATITATKREPAPPIAGTSLDGEDISLDDFRGRPVFVNVWSSW